MRLTIVLATIICSTVAANEPLLQWSVPGRVAESIPIEFPIAQSPVVVREDLVVTAFPPNHLLASDDSIGRRLWIWPWDSGLRYIRTETADLKPYIWTREWGTRSTSFALSIVHDTVVAVDSASNTMYAMNLTPPREGRIRWRAFGTQSDEATLVDVSSLGPPCIVGNNAHCLVASGGTLRCDTLDLPTGESRSQIRIAT
ncbi:MAG: hypothetical protein AAF664_22320, partial [Planctomycetota bacterium]